MASPVASQSLQADYHYLSKRELFGITFVMTWNSFYVVSVLLILCVLLNCHCGVLAEIDAKHENLSETYDLVFAGKSRSKE